ncbi:MAG: sugar ABC transporter substrate-binding protein [Gammaproteobacteria bacterium]|nr:MAG: sugar ABC transporter substrate-binding protein [Gammaproteobacteria bacterium]
MNLRIRETLGRLWVGLLLLGSAAGAAAAEAPMRVGFLAGGDRVNNFWVRMGEFAQAVADDLGIELEIVYPPPATYPIKRAGERLVERLGDGDYFIAVYFDAVTHELMEIAERRGVYTFLINTDILDKDRPLTGRPRQKYLRWLGHIRPDDIQAGFLLGRKLIDALEKPETARIIAINGNTTVQVARDREAGLLKAVADTPGAKVVAAGMGNWEFDPAKVTTARLLEAHPEANIVWAASDPMALGALEAVRSAGRRPGGDVLLGGIDWTYEGLDAVQRGEFVADVGGHFMEAGIALILLYDYHHGHDFAEELGTSFRTPMYAVDGASIAEHMRKTGKKPDWSKIDFKRFTKTHNPDLERYDFSWQAVIDALP